MNRKTQITIERHTVTIIRVRAGRAANLTICANCGANAPSFKFAHAAMIFQTTVPELKRLLLNKRIHCTANNDLCGNSLADLFGREIRLIED